MNPGWNTADFSGFPFMSKKQLILTSLVAALPAAALLYVLGMAAMNHGSGVFGGLRWLPWGIAALCGSGTAVIPVLIVLFPRIAGMAPATVAAAAEKSKLADSPSKESASSVSDEVESDSLPEVTDSEDSYEDEVETVGSDTGEQLFDDEILDDDSSSDFDPFDDDDDKR
jgi:hypothetical protein